MTPQTRQAGSQGTVSDGADSESIEVTPEMRAAGAECLLDALGDRLPVNWPLADEVAGTVFLAMHRRLQRTV